MVSAMFEDRVELLISELVVFCDQVEESPSVKCNTIGFAFEVDLGAAESEPRE